MMRMPTRYRSLRHLAALLVCAALAIGPAAAAEELGPPEGSIAPSIGTLKDETGTPRELESLMGTKGVVIAFYRSAGWCPYCQSQLIDLNNNLTAFRDRGYELVGISYDSPETLQAFVERRAINFTLLSDPDSAVIKRFGLLDPAYPPESRAHGVPRPVIFVLDRDGVITAKLYEESYKDRPPVESILSRIDALPE